MEEGEQVGIVDRFQTKQNGIGSQTAVAQNERREERVLAMSTRASGQLLPPWS